MKSVMKHSFAKVPSMNIQRSKFLRSSGYKTTFDSGYLIPFFCDEALPGDTFNLKTYGITRMTTPIYPIMDNIFHDVFFFAVPMRLLWSNFVRMMGEQDNPDDDTDYLMPSMTSPVGGYDEGSIYDYFGLPTQIAGYEHTSLPLRAYNLIFNTWFRDQNLIDSVPVPLDDGPDDETDFTLLRRGKRFDYFTGCLPWPQKGPEVVLPLGSSAPVVSTNAGGQWFDIGDNPANLRVNQDTVNVYSTYMPVTGDFNMTLQAEADLSNATASSINQFREAIQIQSLLERDARGGTRYTEIIQSHFSVISPDARLQRPEYLGGGTTRINVNQVLSQSGGSGLRPLGDTGAFAIGNIAGLGFTKSFTEHCYIIGLMNVRADLTYQQGLRRMWSRQDKLDFFWPTLAHLGEQEVLNKEIYTQGTADDDLVFGYQERYAEYRYSPSQITGAFRSNAAAPLDAWHLSQEFGSLPTLGQTFIEDNPPFDRVLAVENEPEFFGDYYFDLVCARPMPMYSVPASLGRF